MITEEQLINHVLEAEDHALCGFLLDLRTDGARYLETEANLLTGLVLELDRS